MVFGLKRKPFVRQNTESSTLPLTTLQGTSSKGGDGKEVRVENTGSSSTIEVIPGAAQIQKEAEFIQKSHAWDPNLPDDIRDGIDDALKEHNVDRELEIERELAADCRSITS